MCIRDRLSDFSDAASASPEPEIQAVVAIEDTETASESNVAIEDAGDDAPAEITREQIMMALQSAFQKQDMDAMFVAAKQAYEFDNKDPQFTQLYISALLDQQKYKDAAVVIDALIKSKPDDVEPKVFAVQVYMMMAESSSEDAETLMAIEKGGAILRELKKEKEKVAAIDPSLDDRFFGQFLFDEARVYGQLEKHDKSLASLEEAFASGFNGISNVADEPAFEAIVKRDDYLAMVEKYSKVIEGRLRTQARQELNDLSLIHI